MATKPQVIPTRAYEVFVRSALSGNLQLLL